jgi:PQQ system protein
MTRFLFSAVLAAFSIAVPSARAQSVSETARLLRPEVLRQLNSDTMRLLNFLPEVGSQNKAIVGRLFASGGLGHAKLQKDGTHRIDLRVPTGEFLWRPAIIVMGKPGTLDIYVDNHDKFSHHAILLPNNGGRMSMVLPKYKRGHARIELDGPGYYWYGCPVSNHAGRGMLGLILVLGDVPDEAKLDRPKQRRL